MCGIAFVSDLNERTIRLIPWLGFSIRSRGGDSWGMTNGLKTHRAMGPFTSAANRLPLDDTWFGRPLMLHTRAASVGAVSEENCHPFDITGTARRVIGIHNGGISNHEALNQEFGRAYDCDSPHVFHHIADDLPTKGVNMRGTIVWMENDDPTLHLARTTSGDLYLARLRTGEIVGASTMAAVHSAAEAAELDLDFPYSTIKDEIHHTIAPGAPKDGPPGWQMYIGDPIPFGLGYVYYPQTRGCAVGGSHPQTTYPHGGSGSTKTNTTRKTSGAGTERPFGFIASGGGPVRPPTTHRNMFTVCGYCESPLCSDRPQVLCDLCLSKAIGEFIKETRAADARAAREASNEAGASGLHIVRTPGAAVVSDDSGSGGTSNELALIKSVGVALGVDIQ